MTQPRYALYYAPRPEETLAATASQWLGRNPETGQTSHIRAPWGTDLDRLAKITAEPRHYGFHGTLKPPMALAEGILERDLLEAVGKFATTRRAFAVPPMMLVELSGFLALVPAARCEALQDLADECVLEFDEFRRPADAAELTRRRAAGLSPRQDDLLMRWGYPYVFEEWRFHLTLTGRIGDASERAATKALAQKHFAKFIESPLTVCDLCIFRQPLPQLPFTVLARFTLGGGRRVSTEVWRAS